MIKCELCDFEGLALTPHYVHKHNIKPKDFGYITYDNTVIQKIKKSNLKENRNNYSICQTCGKSTGGRNKKYCSQKCYRTNPNYKNEQKGQKRPDISEWNRKNKPVQTKAWWNNPVNKDKIIERNKKLQGPNLKKGNKGSKNGRWLGGIHKDGYSYEFNKELKIAIKIRDNYTCQMCHRKENKKSFPIHHIDYNKTNSTLENLITLCFSCHTKTNTDRHDWILYFNRNKNVEKIYTSWETIEIFCKQIYEFLRDKNVTGIIPVLRGGVPPAVIVSHLLDIPLKQTVEVDTDIIIDEIVDFGITLQKYKRKYPNNLFVCIDFNEKNFRIKNIKPDFHVRKVKDVYVIYPWEKVTL